MKIEFIFQGNIFQWSDVNYTAPGINYHM